MSLARESYYQATATPQRYQPLQGRQEAEVVVVGGGFAGLNTALGLLERGVKDVMLLEAEHIGFGASGRNGGFVFGGYSRDCAQLLAELGPGPAKALYQLTRQAVDLIRRRIARYAIACEAVDDGVLLANWFDDEARLRRLQSLMQRSFDSDWPWVSREALREELHSARYFGALREPDAFHFHPLNYAYGLARVITLQGGLLHEQSRALAIEENGAGKRIRTLTATVLARTVVIACGGYIERLHPTLAPAILPIATYVMVTEPLHERLASSVNSRAAVYDSRFAFDYYRALPDTRLLWGGRISIRKRSPAAIAALLYRDLRKVYPQLSGVRIDYAWSGLMSYARHQMPQIGQLPDGLYYAQAFGGHGVGPTTLAGELLAGAIAHGEALPKAFARYDLARCHGRLGLLAAQLRYWQAELKDKWRE